MKVWLPFIQTGSGTDTFTKVLADGLQKQGIEVIAKGYPHFLQYIPWVLKLIPLPKGVDITLTNTWNGFAFKRKNSQLIAVQHLFVLDPLLKPYKSFAQSVFHQIFVKYFEKCTQKVADKIVAVSQATAHSYHNCLQGVFPEVIINGIDTDFFTPAVSEQTNTGTEKTFRLLFVGNYSLRKGVDLLPKIMDKLGDNVKLYYTSGLRVKDAVSLHPDMIPLGKMNHQEIRAQYRLADLILFPTRLEGLPLSVMEAMACGTPVLSHNTSSLPEVIQDGHNGKLCLVNDVDCFAQSIKMLDKDRERLKGMSANAHHDANKYFSVGRMVNQYIRLFTQMSLKQ